MGFLIRVVLTLVTPSSVVSLVVSVVASLQKAWAAIALSDLSWASSALSDFSDSLLSSIISGVGSSIIVNSLGSSTLVTFVTGFLSVVTDIYLNLNAVPTIS